MKIGIQSNVVVVYPVWRSISLQTAKQIWSKEGSLGQGQGSLSDFRSIYPIYVITNAQAWNVWINIFISSTPVESFIMIGICNVQCFSCGGHMACHSLCFWKPGKTRSVKKLLTVFDKIKNKRLGSELQAATTVLTTKVRKKKHLRDWNCRPGWSPNQSFHLSLALKFQVTILLYDVICLSWS